MNSSNQSAAPTCLIMRSLEVPGAEKSARCKDTTVVMMKAQEAYCI